MASEDFKFYIDLLAAAANIFTILASSLAIGIWYRNRDKISSALKLLLNFSFQLTLGELKEKLERLNTTPQNLQKSMR